MDKFIIYFHWSDGEVDEDDNYGLYYSSEEEAEEAAQYGLSCRKTGAEILHWSNPGDNPYDEEDFEDDWYEIREVD